MNHLFKPRFYIIFAGEGRVLPTEGNSERWVVAKSEEEALVQTKVKFP